jgi:beta-glucosidase
VTDDRGRLMRLYPQRRRANPTTQRIMFATGIECSYPTIRTPDGRVRVDELEKCGHYARWREDLALVRELGLRYLRYGPPYYRMHLGAGRYDFSWTDEVLPEVRRLGIVPLVDLCHFGVPDWIGDFQNPEWPAHFAAFAKSFARRYPWVRLYTPVNEMYVCAKFSAYYGWWNEGLRSDRAFVAAVANLARANVEAMLAILAVRQDALFVQAESSEYYHPGRPDLQDEAELFNSRKFLPLDLNYGRRLGSGMLTYVLDNGLAEDAYAWFLGWDLREHCILGTDYYVTNEHLLVDEDAAVFTGDVFGYYVVTREYFARYGLPILHTETNLAGAGAEQWLWKTWCNVARLRADGVPVVGMTWYSLTDQVDWDTALREPNGTVTPVGLYDLDRRLRPVGAAYKRLVEEWGDAPLLPSGPLTLLGRRRPEAAAAVGRA